MTIALWVFSAAHAGFSSQYTKADRYKVKLHRIVIDVTNFIIRKPIKL